MSLAHYENALKSDWQERFFYLNPDGMKSFN